MPEFGSALELFFGDALTGDDVFDWHGLILIQNPTPALPKRGGSRLLLADTPLHLERGRGRGSYPALVNRPYFHFNASRLG